MKLISYFFKLYPQRTIVVCIAVTISSIFSAISLAALPALLASMFGKDGTKAKLLAQVFEYFNTHPTTETLLIFIGAGLLLKSIILAGAKIYAGFTVAKVVKDLRIKLLAAVSNAEWSYFTNLKSGVLTSSLLDESEQAGKGYMISIDILASIVQLFAYLIVAFLISWEVALITILTTLTLSFLFKKFISISKTLGSQDTSLVRQITSQLNDSTRSIKSLKAMARESHSIELLDSYTKQLKSVKKKSVVVSESLEVAQEISLMATIVLTIYFAFNNLQIPLGSLIVIAIIYIRAMKLFGKSQKRLQQYVITISKFDGIMDSINTAQANSEKRNGKIKHKINSNIQIKNISFSYQEKIILDNASATIYYNKVNSIVGPSGTGKTTLVDLLCGLQSPMSGDIYTAGISLNNMDIKYWRSQIGYVVQEHSLLNTSIKRNITLGDMSFTKEQIYEALKKAHAFEFVDKLPKGIRTIVGEGGAKLSGGQRQRILIARALINSPKILILDEATSALDMKTEKLISDLFKELSSEITIISISHRPAIVDISDHILELKDGKIAEKI